MIATTRRTPPLAAGLLILAAAGCGTDETMSGQAPETARRAHGDLPTGEGLAALPPDGGEEFNRLVFAQSPYLLQHARNPVDWYPWGEAAFARAREEDKPIFLSIGYATCHWCHVMERESFENESIAAFLNEHFVPIKLDREERPDIDAIYMSYCTAVTGRGGWPLSIFMTPEGKPFFAGTYFPPESTRGMPGFLDVLREMQGAWTQQRERVLDVAGRAAEALAAPPDTSGDLPGEATLRKGYEQFAARFDRRHGGFGSAPKFPSPHTLTFLLRGWSRSGEAAALGMVETTLTAMARGGIRDHLGGGFHRYSTDAEWLVPHFEKMLYDQAMLAIAYLEAYQATRNDLYAETARDIFGYLLRDMTAPEGAFDSAEDADSEGMEGTFYVWRPEGIREVLGETRGERFCRFYDVTDNGNFHEPHGPERHSILRETEALASFAEREGVDPETLAVEFAEDRAKLLAAREHRVHPAKDDKILTDWNGLAIAALAMGGRVLDDDRYTEAAARAAGFLLETMRDADGRLLHRYRNGTAGIPAQLDDHAFLAWGLLELYETSFDPRDLGEAIRLAEEMDRLFLDAERGGYFLTAADTAAELIARTKEAYDGAYPSGNSVAACVLVRLARLTGREAWTERAEGILQAFGDPLERAPSGFAQMLQAVDLLAGPTNEIVIAGDPGAEDTRAMLDALHGRFLPRAVVLLRPPGEAGDAIAELAPYTAGQLPIDGAATAYVCENFTCRAPTTSVDVMLENLGLGE